MTTFVLQTPNGTFLRQGSINIIGINKPTFKTVQQVNEATVYHSEDELQEGIEGLGGSGKVLFDAAVRRTVMERRIVVLTGDVPC